MSGFGAATVAGDGTEDTADAKADGEIFTAAGEAFDFEHDSRLQWASPQILHTGAFIRHASC
jgi:hypothetical protein